MKNLYDLNDEILQKILKDIAAKDTLSDEDINLTITITRLLTERHKIDSNERTAAEERKSREKLAQDANMLDSQKAMAERELKERLSKDERESKERISKDDRTAGIERMKAELESKERISKDDRDSKERISQSDRKADAEKAEADRESRERMSKEERKAEDERYCKEFWSNVISTIGNVGGTALNVITLIALFKAGLIFEENGVISSSMVKGLSGKMFNLLGKK